MTKDKYYCDTSLVSIEEQECGGEVKLQIRVIITIHFTCYVGRKPDHFDLKSTFLQLIFETVLSLLIS